MKDTFYKFNFDSDEYDALLENFEEMQMQNISYKLAHNIIYASVEFAEEYGFKPHKDFTSITRFMLEEDTDDVELIEIELGGIDGNPMYVNSGFESSAREKQIYAQLEKTAGKGNFDIISSKSKLSPNNKIDKDYDIQDTDFSKYMLDE